MSSEPTAPASARVWIDADMDAPVRVPLSGGEAWVYSRRCRDKAENQDAVGCFLHETGGVLVVADGMGGQAGGANASRTLLECLRDRLADPEPFEAGVRAAILDAIEEANRQVLGLGVGAGTTLAATEIFVDTLRPYHVGDSEILAVGQRGRVRMRTVSHSPVGYAVEAGMLDGEDAIHHDERHLVSNLVGSSEMRIEVGSPLSLNRYDTLLLATDGVVDNLHLREIVDAIRTGPPQEAAERLARAAATRMDEPAQGQPSKPDDLSFVLYRRR